MSGHFSRTYVSYHNINLPLALQLGSDLICAGGNIFFDRLSIDSIHDWDAELLHAPTECDGAIVIFSAEYAQTDYCLAEFDRLVAQGCGIVFLRTDATDIAPFTQKTTQAQVLAFENWLDSATYQKQLRALVGITAPPESDLIELSPEEQYLIRLIAQLERKLTSTLLAKHFISNNKPDTGGGVPLRSRCHHPQIWLEEGQYRLQEQVELDLTLILDHDERSELVVENLLEWLEVRPQMALIGEKGCGKTHLLYHLVLNASHQRLRDRTRPVPLLAHLIDWEENLDFDTFIRQQWTVNIDPYELLQQDKLILYLDGLNELPGQPAQRITSLRKWVNGDNTPSVVVTCRTDAFYRIMSLPLPVVRMTSLSNTQINELLQVMPEDCANRLEPVIERISADDDSIIPLTPEYFSLLAVLAMHDGVTITSDTRTDILARVTSELWNRLGMEMRGRYSQRNITQALQQFSLALLDAGFEVYAPRQLALSTMHDEIIIQIIEYMGVLVVHGNYVRFAHPALQTYFASEALTQDGIYTRLFYPQFNDHGGRVRTIWDDVIVMALEMMPLASRESAIMTIAEVDPYLALACVSDLPIATPYLKEEIISKLLDHQRAGQRSLNATIAIFQNLPQNLVIGLILHGLRQGEWRSRLMAYNYLLHLPPLSVPAELLSDLQQVDRHLPDTAFLLQEQYEEKLFIPTLLKLLSHHNTQMRQTAIWLLGELREIGATTGITAMGSDERPEILTEAALALGKIKDDQAFTFLMRILRSKHTTVIRSALWALSQIGWTITPKLLTLIYDATDHLPEALLSSLEEIRDDHHIAVVIYRAVPQEQFDVPSNISALDMGENVNWLGKYLTETMGALNSREAFNTFVDDLKDYFGNKSVVEKTEPQRREVIEARIRGTVQAARVPDENPAVQAALQALEKHDRLPKKLLLALDHPEWLIRMKAVKQLRRYPPRLSLPALLKVTKDTDIQVRSAAIEALPDPNQYPVVIESLLEAIDDREYHVLDAATDKLKLCGARISPQLVRKLGTASLSTLGAILELLGELGDESSVPHISFYLADDRRTWVGKEIGEIAAQALMLIGTAEALLAVQEAGRISYETADEVLRPGIEYLGKGEDPILAEMIDALHTDDWNTSQQAARDVRAYAKNLKGNHAAARQMARQLADDNWVVRWTAAESLAWMGDLSVATEITKLLKDTNWIVQIAAIRSLVELHATETVGKIALLLGDENSSVREASVEAIGILAGQEGLSLLKRALKDKDQFVRFIAVKAISEIDSPARIPTLVKVLEDPFVDIRWTAMMFLKDTADPSLVVPFTKRLKDDDSPEWEDDKISKLAYQGLEKIGTPDSQRVLVKWHEIQMKKQKTGGEG